MADVIVLFVLFTIVFFGGYLIGGRKRRWSSASAGDTPTRERGAITHTSADADLLEADRRRIWAAINAWEERGYRLGEGGKLEPTDVVHKPLSPFFDELRAIVFGELTPAQRIMRDFQWDVDNQTTIWHLINQLADEVEGIDGNVIRGWLDTTVRSAVMGYTDDEYLTDDEVRKQYLPGPDD